MYQNVLKSNSLALGCNGCKPPTLAAFSFAVLLHVYRDPLLCTVHLWKDLTLSENKVSAEETGYIFKINFALPKLPHYHSVYLLGGSLFCSHLYNESNRASTFFFHKLTKVQRKKVLNFNRTPAFYFRGNSTHYQSLCKNFGIHDVIYTMSLRKKTWIPALSQGLWHRLFFFGNQQNSDSTFQRKTLMSLPYSSNGRQVKWMSKVKPSLQEQWAPLSKRKL